MKKNSYTTFIILLMLIIQNIGLGQSSYHANFGVVLGNNGNLLETLTNNIKSFRTGYQFGVNGTFGTYSFFISPGLYYKDLTINNQFKKIDPFIKSPRLKIAKAKVILGYQTNLFTKKIKFRVGGGVNGNYIINIDKNEDDFSIETLEDTFYAYSFDIGLDIYFLNFSISYEKSMKNVISSSSSSSKFDYLIFSTGLLF